MVERLTGGRRATLWRLLGLQATWTYERMQGVGLAYAAEPLLRHVLGGESGRFRPALARAAGFYNANPYLAALAIGAEARAEADGAPPEQIERLRSALSGPLGAIGDLLFWAGLVPAMASATITAVALGAGVWPVIVFVVIHNAIRLRLAGWLLELGWRHGRGVGSALAGSWLPQASHAASRAAAFFGAMALPVIAARLLADAPVRDVAGVGAVVAGALVLRLLPGARLSPLTLTFLVAAGVLLWQVGAG